jgi:dTDP-4-amino-4,6-dideoxygalactose transaminase
VRYGQLLADVPGLGLPVEPAWARSNWQSYCVRLPDGADQLTVMQTMLDAGVSTRRGIMCAHREPAYAKEPWSCTGNGPCTCSPPGCTRLRESERAQDGTIILPLFHDLGAADQETVARALREACASRPVAAAAR